MNKALFFLGSVVVSVLSAQVPTPVAGQNVNMVTGITFPNGDPYLQKQNEGSLAVSTRNHSHLLGGSNDSRGVDYNLIVNGETGDNWVSWYKSFDGGQTWRSNLMPGCPYTTPSGAPLPQCASDPKSPIFGKYTVAADSTIRSGPNGLFYFSALYTNRGNNALGAVAISRFIDQNNAEKVTSDPVQYIDTQVIESGTSGRFLDKPWIGVGRIRPNESCVINGQTFKPAHDVYIVYAVFTGSTSSKINIRRSTDCGTTWENPQTISQTNSINQGTQLAIDTDPATGLTTVWVAWRRFKTSSDPDAIVYTNTIANDARNFKFNNKNTDLVGYRGPNDSVAAFRPFDQGTTAGSFRTNAYPALAVSVDQFGGRRLHIAWSQRNTELNGGDARVVMATTPLGSSQTGITWNMVPVDNPTVPSSAYNLGRGHQIMPSMTFAGGKVIVSYLSFQNDSTFGQLQCVTGACDGFRFSDYVENRVPDGNLAVNQPLSVFTSQVIDATPAGQAKLLRRHSVDVRVAQAFPADSPVFASSRVSRYRWGSIDSNTLKQAQFNLPNLPLFVGGTAPFFGDYIDIASVPFVFDQTSKQWVANTKRDHPGWAHVVWTDNRDVIPPYDGNWQNYAPAIDANGNCTFSKTAGTRNQNIYTAVVNDGLAAFTLSSSKDSNGDRTYAFVVQNSNISGQPLNATISIEGDASATFQKGSLNRTLTGQQIRPTGLIARTVFLPKSGDPNNVNIRVVSGAINFVFNLRPDASNPVNLDLQGSSESFGAIMSLIGTGYRNLDMVNKSATNLDMVNLDMVNLDMVNLDMVNLDMVNLDMVNLDMVNLDMVNLDMVNLDMVNLDMVNLDMVNTTVQNLDMVNTSLVDTSWKLQNTSTTTTSFNVRLAKRTDLPQCSTTVTTNCVQKQELIVHRTYKSPTLTGRTSPGAKGQCLAQAPINLVAVNTPPTLYNISDPNLGVPDLTTGDPTNATVAIAPGEEVRVTWRVVGKFASENNLRDTMSTYVKSQIKAVGVAHPSTIVTLLIVNNTTTLAVERGVPVNYQFQATGSQGTVTWTSQNLPSGLNLSSTGLLTGTVNQTGTFTFTIIATDKNTTTGATNGTDQFNFTVNIQDTTPPVINSVAATAGGQPYTGSWTNQPVSVVFGCTDANNGTTTVTPNPATVSSEGTNQSAQATCVDSANNKAVLSNPAPAGVTMPVAGSGTAVYGGINIDLTAPTINVTLPVAGTNYAQGQSYTVAVGCTDSLSGVKSCTPSITTLDTTTTGAKQFTVTAVDNAGNSVTQTISYNVTDQTPPVLSFVGATFNGQPYTAGTWVNGPVSVSWNCVDTPAGVTTITPSSPVVVDVAAPGSGALSATASCVDAAGNKATVVAAVGVTDNGGGSASWGPIRIDKAVPTITITSPASGAQYLQGDKPVPAATCADQAGLSGVKTCTPPPIDTSTAGTKTYTMTATDNAGNVGTATVSYTVFPSWTFTGFFNPLGLAGTDSGTFNLGRAIAVKFTVADGNGVQQTAVPGPITSLSATPSGACAATGTGGVLYPSATGGTILRNNNQYVFNWDTTGYTGCWRIVLQLTDGKSYSTTLRLQ